MVNPQGWKEVTWKVKKLLFLLLLISTPAQATTRWLYWTNTCYNVARVWTVDDNGNTIEISDCSQNGEFISDLSYVILYGWPAIPNGVAHEIARKPVRSLGCNPDSMSFDDQGLSWHIFLISFDTSGNGECKSNVAYIGTVTDVPIASVDKEEKTLIFDVRGRLVSCNNPLASGVYFYKTWYKSGKIKSGKLPVILK